MSVIIYHHSISYHFSRRYGVDAQPLFVAPIFGHVRRTSKPMTAQREQISSAKVS